MKTILVIDDDDQQRRLLSLQLGGLGYKVVVAGDAVTAVSVARSTHPDLVILDLGLPGGDGFVVMERFSALLPLSNIPVIILTGRDADLLRERAAAAGAVAFLTKPTDTGQLEAAVANVLVSGVKGNRAASKIQN